MNDCIGCGAGKAAEIEASGRCVDCPLGSQTLDAETLEFLEFNATACLMCPAGKSGWDYVRKRRTVRSAHWWRWRRELA